MPTDAASYTPQSPVVLGSSVRVLCGETSSSEPHCPFVRYPPRHTNFLPHPRPLQL